MAVYRTEEGIAHKMLQFIHLKRICLIVLEVLLFSNQYLLKHDHSVYSSVKRTLEAASNDKHPSVRMAVIEHVYRFIISM
jgi:hypothetical protein